MRSFVRRNKEYFDIFLSSIFASTIDEKVRVKSYSAEEHQPVRDTQCFESV